MPSPLLSRKCAQTLLCQTSCSGFKLLFEEYCRRFPVKCLCNPHLLKHSSPCPYLISEWCAYSEGVCRFIIPIISGVLSRSLSAEWCRMNFQPVRQRNERCSDAAASSIDGIAADRNSGKSLCEMQVFPYTELHRQKRYQKRTAALRFAIVNAPALFCVICLIFCCLIFCCLLLCFFNFFLKHRLPLLIQPDAF